MTASFSPSRPRVRDRCLPDLCRTGTTFVVPVLQRRKYLPKPYHMAKPGQTLHMGGQWGPSGVQGMLHITTFHSDGHEWWALARGSPGYHRTCTGLVVVNWRGTPHLDTINMKANKIKHCRLTRDPIGTHHVKDLSNGGHVIVYGCDSGHFWYHGQHDLCGGNRPES